MNIMIPGIYNKVIVSLMVIMAMQAAHLESSVDNTPIIIENQLDKIIYVGTSYNTLSTRAQAVLPQHESHKIESSAYSSGKVYSLSTVTIVIIGTGTYFIDAQDILAKGAKLRVKSVGTKPLFEVYDATLGTWSEVKPRCSWYTS